MTVKVAGQLRRGPVTATGLLIYRLQNNVVQVTFELPPDMRCLAGAARGLARLERFGFRYFVNQLRHGRGQIGKGRSAGKQFVQGNAKRINVRSGAERLSR